jgi:hypothetical protein
MRARHLIGVVVIIICTLHLAAGGLIGFQSKKSAQNINIEKTMQTVATQKMVAPPVSSAEENNSIFSNTIIFSLIAVIAGVVAFRRDTNS